MRMDILYINFICSLSILIVSLCRCIKKIDKSAICLLWMFIMLRMSIPFSFQISVKSDDNILLKDYSYIISDALQSVTDQQGQNVSGPVIHEALSLWDVFAFIWLIGTVTLFIKSIVYYLRVRHFLCSCTWLYDNVYRNETDNSSFAIGHVHPRIVLGRNVSPKDECFVLEHENEHIRHKDNWIKFWMQCLLIVFWWNPCLWLMRCFLEEDLEYRCDEHVLHGKSRDYCKGYALAIANYSLQSKMNYVSDFSKQISAKRIQSIVRMHSKKACYGIIAMALMGVVCTISLWRPSYASQMVRYERQHDLLNVVVEFNQKEYCAEDPIRMGVVFKNTSNRKLYLPFPYDAKTDTPLLSIGICDTEYILSCLNISPDAMIEKNTYELNPGESIRFDGEYHVDTRGQLEEKPIIVGGDYKGYVTFYVGTVVDYSIPYAVFFELTLKN